MAHSRGVKRVVVDCRPHPRVLGLVIATLSCGHVVSLLEGDYARCPECRDAMRLRKRIDALLGR